MKKILMLITLIIMITSSVCYAFDTTSERFVLLKDTGSSKSWLDKDSINYTYENNKRSQCYNHRIVQLCTMEYDEKDKKEPYKQIGMHWDLDCRTILVVSVTNYNKKLKKRSSYYIADKMDPRPIPKNTVLEKIYYYLEDKWAEKFL